MALQAHSPVQYLKGVGPKRAEAFAAIGLRTVGDLLEYYPFRHETVHGELDIAELRPGVTATIKGEITHVERRGPTVSVEIDDGTQPCLLRWFNTRYLPRGMSHGATVVATGTAQDYNGVLTLVQPSAQVYERDAVLMSREGKARLRGVYRGNPQINSSAIRRTIDTILDQGRLPVEESLPPRIVSRHQLVSREQAVRDMHQPESEADLAEARRRLAFEEFFLMELAMALRRHRTMSLQRGRKLHVTSEVDQRIRTRFPFALTKYQDQAVREICRDLQSGRPMTRLLQGDVGSGKTVVALYAALAAIANGCQAAIMAPTEILAQQHFNNIERYLEGSRVRRVLLRGRLPKRDRADALSRIGAGEADLIVGTQALVQKDVEFAQLGLVVVDEQHKFGVAQRAGLRTKGPMPHCLVMTATPIPRSLAMTVLGDLDVSLVRGAPPGRGAITTRVVTPGKWSTVMKHVRKRLLDGEQAFVVCPLIGESETSREPASPMGAGESGRDANRAAAVVSASAAHDSLVTGPWSDLRVGLLHGSLPTAEKRRTVDDFAGGRLHAVVSTTVVEVGVDVPNATIMIVENADRFGLSQLHQLRGRVGRGSKDSLCVLIARSRGAKARERLAAMTATTDGFRIAEADLRMRGPGEVLGTRQHGLPELRVGDIVGDFALLQQARDDAFALVADDPALQQPAHARLMPAVRRLFADKLAYIDAG